MKSKSIKLAAVFILLELFFLQRSSKEGLEMFFMMWGSFHLIFLLYNIFNTDSDRAVSSRDIKVAFSSRNLIPVTSDDKRKSGSEKSRDSGLAEGLYNKYNIVFLLLFLVNAIGYIVVMPK